MKVTIDNILDIFLNLKIIKGVHSHFVFYIRGKIRFRLFFFGIQELYSGRNLWVQ
jgi:hypothetical protein